eukprot:g36371.t1
MEAEQPKFLQYFLISQSSSVLWLFSVSNASVFLFCPTDENQAQYFIQQLPTYIRDTTHALHLLQNFQFPDPQHLIFTMYVQTLYTCIPHADGLKALRFFLS